MDRNFTRSLGAVLDEEGGFSNHPSDPGGATMRGVTLASFRAYVKPEGTVADLKALTAEQAGVVYRREYWDKVVGAELPDGVDHSVFDFAVNSGPGRAAKFLQEIVGAKVDGAIGPNTLKKVRDMDPDAIIAALNDKRLTFLEGLPTWKTFGNGWTARVNRVRALSLELAAQPADAAIVVVKHIDVDREVVVTPKGADKRKWVWPAGLTAFAAQFFTTLADLPLSVKLTIGGVGLAAVVVFLWRGEVVIQRFKALRKEVEGT